MTSRFHHSPVGIGAGITVFLLIAVAVIEVVTVDPGAGILGVLLGMLAAVVAFGAVALQLDDRRGRPCWAVEAVAAFG